MHREHHKLIAWHRWADQLAQRRHHHQHPLTMIINCVLELVPTSMIQFVRLTMIPMSLESLGIGAWWTHTMTVNVLLIQRNLFQLLTVIVKNLTIIERLVAWNLSWRRFFYKSFMYTLFEINHWQRTKYNNKIVEMPEHSVLYSFHFKYWES